MSQYFFHIVDGILQRIRERAHLRRLRVSNSCDEVLGIGKQIAPSRLLMDLKAAFMASSKPSRLRGRRGRVIDGDCLSELSYIASPAQHLGGGRTLGLAASLEILRVLNYELPCAFNRSASICATFFTEGRAFHRST